MIGLIGVLLGSAIVFFTHFCVALYNNSQEKRRNIRELRIQKLEELHQLLMEIHLRIFVRHSNALSMCRDGVPPNVIDEFLKSSGPNDFFILRSRTITLSIVYAPDFDVNNTNGLEYFFPAFDKFAQNYINGKVDLKELDELDKKLEGFSSESHLHMEQLSNRLKDIVNTN